MMYVMKEASSKLIALASPWEWSVLGLGRSAGDRGAKVERINLAVA